MENSNQISMMDGLYESITKENDFIKELRKLFRLCLFYKQRTSDKSIALEYEILNLRLLSIASNRGVLKDFNGSGMQSYSESVVNPLEGLKIARRAMYHFIRDYDLTDYDHKLIFKALKDLEKVL